MLGWSEDLDLDVQDTNPSGQNRLCVASYEGHLSIVKFLLEAGFNPNINDKLASLPLISAIEHDDIFKLLLDNRANPTIRACYKEHLTTPMLRLVQSEKTSLVLLLLNRDNYHEDTLFPDPLKYELLRSAVVGGPDIMELLFKDI